MATETNTAGAANYAGDVSPQQAYDAIKRDPGAALVDCRTQPEWSFVGIPDLRDAGKQPVLVEWQAYPAMALNPNFVADAARAGIAKGRAVYFLCRSGVRSLVVVTSPSHTRRARLILRQVLEPRVLLAVRPAPADYFPPQWWKRRAAAKLVLSEYQKLAHYWLRERWQLRACGA